MPFKIRTKLITAFLIILFAIMGFAGIIAVYNQNALHNSIHVFVETVYARASVSEVRFAMERVLMPGNDYIITGDRRYIDDFQKDSVDLEERFKKLEELAGQWTEEERLRR